VVSRRGVVLSRDLSLGDARARVGDGSSEASVFGRVVASPDENALTETRTFSRRAFRRNRDWMTTTARRRSRNARRSSARRHAA
jgi:hypothetical protein